MHRNSIGEMEQLIASVSTELLFNEKLARQEQSIRRKQEDLTNLVGPEFGYRNRELLLPKGFVSGVQLETVLRRLARVRGVRKFDELPIAYRAVATDLTTGKAVVFADGELANAMRASMSVAGAIAPAEFDGKIFVDGGLSDNLPVDVARSMGADIVIAVNLGTPLLKREALGSLFGVTAQMVNILTEQNVGASLASLQPTDILIEPELSEFSFADFDNMPKTLPIGEAAARKVAEWLAALSLRPAAYAALRQRQQSEPQPAPRAIDEIRFGGLHRVEPRFAATLLDTRAGQPIDSVLLDRDIHRLYGTGDFEHVTYRVLEEQGRSILVIDAVEKSWGPDYLRFGVGMSSDFRGDAYYNLLARHRRTWLNSLGAEWRNEVQIGRADRFFTELYQPLLVGQSLFVAPYGQIERRPVDLFAGEQRIARYDVRSALAGFDLGIQAAKFGEARLGLIFGRARARLDTGPQTLVPPKVGASQAAVRLRLFVDQIDSANFPRAGYGGSLTLFGARRGIGAETSYNRWDADGTYVRSFGAHTINLGVKLGGRSGTAALPRYDLFQWGGFLQQSGYRTGALVGESIAFGRLVYYNKLVRQTLLEGLYAGFSLEAGEVRDPLVPDSPVGLLKSGSVFLAFDTPLGPLYLAYGRTTDSLSSYYLFLGKP
jgi:NTE family protein